MNRSVEILKKDFYGYGLPLSDSSFQDHDAALERFPVCQCAADIGICVSHPFQTLPTGVLVAGALEKAADDASRPAESGLN